MTSVKTHSFFLFVFFVFGFIQNIHGQNYQRFRHITINDGLAHTDALCFEQDDKGFIWIGTNSGLQRYDGYDLELFFNRQAPNDQVYNNRITALAEMNDYLWIGTEGGIHCLNLKKQKFVSLQINDSTGLSSTKPVSEIIILDQSIWFIAGRNLLKADFDAGTNILEVKNPLNLSGILNSGFPPIEVVSFTNDDSGNLWIGTTQGVLYYDLASRNSMLIQRLNSPKLEGNLGAIVDIEYKEDLLWVLAQNKIFSLTLDEAIRGETPIHTVLDINQLRSRLSSSEMLEISAFYVDTQKNLWASTPRGLVFVRDPLSENPMVEVLKKSPYFEYTLESDHISSIFEDQKKCLWVGTWGGGVNILDLEQKKFNLVKYKGYKNGSFFPGNNFVRAVVEDENKMIWIGTKNNGILIFDPSQEKVFNQYNGIEINERICNRSIRSLASIPGAILIGTLHGLSVFDLSTGAVKSITYNPDDSETIPPFAIYSLAIDSHKNIWAGSWGGGLFKIRLFDDFTLESIEVYNEAHPDFKTSSNTIPFVFVDSSKNEILASSSHGLNRIWLDQQGDVKRIGYYRSNESSTSLSSEYVWPIVKENDSTYWLGTLGGGLNRVILRNEFDDFGHGQYTASAFGSSQGLPGNDVESLIRDNDGFLWIGGSGLSRFNPKDSSFWHFDARDGLQSDGFKIGAAQKGSDGTLYFGGIKGLNYFIPQLIEKNDIQADVIISRLEVKGDLVMPDRKNNGQVILDEDISFKDKIKLNYQQNDFRLHLSSGHYANPQKCKFRYSLKGFDEGWNIVSGEYPVINYTNLRYGEYDLKIQASNNDGVWSEDLASLGITITPPWWMSTGAYIGYVVIYLFVMWVIYYYLSRLVKMKNNIKLIEAKEQKNEEINKMKIQFFTNISHEFKTPLSLILTPVERMLSQELGRSEQRRLLSIVANNSQRLLNLITELIDFRKAEGGDLRLRAKKQEFIGFLKNITDSFSENSKVKNIAFDVDSRKEEELWFDGEKMIKIITNLLSNAFKFTPEGGNINVTVFRGRIDALKPTFENYFFEKSPYPSSQYLFLKVSDNGIGISEGSIKKIFQRYYQVSDSGNNHLGSGIGLALVKSLVFLHKGLVFVSSEREKGTEFVVGFPVGSEHLAESEVIDDSISADYPQSVSGISAVSNDLEEDYIHEEGNDEKPFLLIVEDNVDLRGMLRDSFKDEYQVKEAGNGEEALNIIKEDLPDLIISDLMMPVMDGMTLLKNIRADINMSHLPVIVLTAKSSVEDQIEGVEGGADLYVPKPFSLNLLVAQVRKMIKTRTDLKEKYSSDVFADCREIARNSKDRDFLDRFIQIIDENMDNNEFSVDDLTVKLGIGRTNLYKKVKSLTGQSMGDFIRDIRMKKAAKILSSEDVSISEVIYRIGLNSNSYFTKAFKQKFGMTPSEFIQNERKQ
ncbi:hybrid sensor histidine kinase/response regulator transcription factor [Thermophagus sp. OGC60D27]|uniref:hybrid sensor histidine kinase/response regulator transcription factor n=1 Tax=Thermophagus sp. OGC60D27 TaxID=3458415 RepID=UPI004037A8D1